MEINNLYKYSKEDGKVTHSLTEPNKKDYELRFRLSADYKMNLTKDGETLYSVIDVDKIDGWYEVPFTKEQLRELKKHEEMMAKLNPDTE